MQRSSHPLNLPYSPHIDWNIRSRGVKRLEITLMRYIKSKGTEINMKNIRFREGGQKT